MKRRGRIESPNHTQARSPDAGFAPELSGLQRGEDRIPAVASGSGFAFGPFTLDPSSERLLCDGKPIRLTPPHVRVLHALVSRAGEIVHKDALVTAGWAGAFMGDNNLAQAMLRLRRVLDAGDPHRYIETIPRVGYRFVGAIERVRPSHTDADLAAILAPHRALMDGRAALKTLERTEIARARSTFEAQLARDPREPAFHVGLANACAMQYEMTRADASPDAEALRLAATHAREACRLAARNGEAWATLGFVLERTHERADALAALRRSIALEPDDWQHHLRLSAASWGNERLRAARRTLEIFRDVPSAHWLAATVLVARENFAEAERELDDGLASARDESNEPARFSAVGLHWLKGLLCLARGADVEAGASFERELALEARGHLYTRECCANTWYAIGACRLRRGDTSAACAAFERAIARVSAHPMARAGLSIAADREAGGSIAIDPRPIHGQAAASPQAGPAPSVDQALAAVTLLVARGDAPAAAPVVDAAIASAPSGNAG